MQNLLGAYGPWAAQLVGRKIGKLSFRSGNFSTVDSWRLQAREETWRCLAAPDAAATPAAQVHSSGEYDGLSVERLSWQLPWGPRTEALFLKPAGASGKLPALLALHDHGGMKYFGWRKIARDGGDDHPMLMDLRERCYGGLAWANEAARRGYAVLAPDAFLFGSRRVRLADVPDRIRGGVNDPGPAESTEEVEGYNQWAGEHESIAAKSLFSAGTTWPGVFLREDQAALDVLCARPDVDTENVGCGGLSGGGLRTVYLAGLDDRIRCCFCAGFFTTWVDILLNKSFTHTWMTYTPLLPRDLEFPEILGLRAPLPTLVLNCTEDPLFTTEEVKIAGDILAEVYRLSGAPDAFRLSLYPGGHKLDAPMQKEAFNWLDRWLRPA